MGEGRSSEEESVKSEEPEHVPAQQQQQAVVEAAVAAAPARWSGGWPLSPAGIVIELARVCCLPGCGQQQEAGQWW